MRRVITSPLCLNQLTRQYWGMYDAAVMAQLAGLDQDRCYQIKYYKAPADNQEILQPNDYKTYGLYITPGSIIYGIYLPATVNTSNPTLSAPNQFTLKVTDTTLDHDIFDEPVGSLLVSNYKPEYQSNVSGASAQSGYLVTGSFPYLLPAPHPVVGTGLFDIVIQETSGNIQRIEVVFGVLEVCRAS